MPMGAYCSETLNRLSECPRNSRSPGRCSQEYVKILKLAAESGEVQVDEALRELLAGKTDAAITAETIREVLAKLDAIAPVTMVEVAPVDLESYDRLCGAMGAQL